MYLGWKTYYSYIEGGSIFLGGQHNRFAMYVHVRFCICINSIQQERYLWKQRHALQHSTGTEKEFLFKEKDSSELVGTPNDLFGLVT